MIVLSNGYDGRFSVYNTQHNHSLMNNQTTTLNAGKARTSATAALREWLRRENRFATSLAKGVTDQRITNRELLAAANAGGAIFALLAVAESGSIAVITSVLAWCALSLTQLRKGGAR